MRILSCILILFSHLSITCYAQNLPVPPLPYDYDQLEPFMDEATLRVHHLGHHAASTHTLNKVLSTLREDPATKHLAKMGIDRLLEHLSEVPEGLREALAHSGGGYVNHELFWKSMKPGGGGYPSTTEESTRFSEAVAANFLSIDNMKQEFTNQALQIYGSGWAWLVFDSVTSKMEVMTTSNQDHPVMLRPGIFVLIALDVWEHAYYLKHQNRRVEYIESFWSVIDWDEVSHRFANAPQHLLDNSHSEL